VPYQVAVCGPAECTDLEREQAYEIGALLADRGAVVLCGGGTGVMAAVAAGARSRGGLVVGIRPDLAPAPDATVSVATGLGEARNAVLVNSADAVIAVGGSWGTLSEVALAMRRGGVPVAALGGWRVADAAGRPVPGIAAADTADAAVAAIITALALRHGSAAQ
jgi:uncharacterized protein (TIGR00725 family)